MKKIVTQVILAFLLATIIMAFPLYFEKQKTIETRIGKEGEYGTVGAPAVAIETEHTTTTVDKNKVDYTNVYMMIFISIIISFIITIIFIRIRI